MNPQSRKKCIIINLKQKIVLMTGFGQKKWEQEL